MVRCNCCNKAKERLPERVTFEMNPEGEKEPALAGGGWGAGKVSVGRESEYYTEDRLRVLAEEARVSRGQDECFGMRWGGAPGPVRWGP